MRFERFESGSAQPALGAVFGAVLLVAGLLAGVWRSLSLPVPRCPFHAWTGVPCPGCGTTRMVDAVLAGDLAGAAAFNPLVFAGLAGIALWAVLSGSRLALGLPARRIVLEPRERTALRLLATAVVLAGWTYLIWRAV